MAQRALRPGTRGSKIVPRRDGTRLGAPAALAGWAELAPTSAKLGLPAQLGIVVRTSSRARSTSSAIREIGWCVQTRTTRHPACLSAASLRRSWFTLRESFASHHARFALGITTCSAHRCQKQPSTNTATFAAGNAISTRHRTPGSALYCLRNLRPRRCNVARNSRSAALSDRLPTMTLRACSDDAGGDGSSITSVGSCMIPDQPSPPDQRTATDARADAPRS